MDLRESDQRFQTQDAPSSMEYDKNNDFLRVKNKDVTEGKNKDFEGK